MSDGTELPASWGADENGPSSGRWLKWLGGVVVLALLVAGGVIAAQQISKNTKKAWPALLSVRPGGLGQQGDKPADTTTDLPPGAYLWNDFDGWHLWIVNGSGVGPVRGTLSSDKSFARSTLATPKVGSIKADGSTITFSLPADSKVVGIDFSPDFYAKRIELKLDENIPVFEGNVKKRVKLPVVIDKLDASDPAAAK